jgi:hypothetical protein
MPDETPNATVFNILRELIRRNSDPDFQDDTLFRKLPSCCGPFISNRFPRPDGV